MLPGKISGTRKQREGQKDLNNMMKKLQDYVRVGSDRFLKRQKQKIPFGDSNHRNKYF